MTNENPEELVDEFNELASDIMKYKSVSAFEAGQIAANFFIRGIHPKSREFEEEIMNVKTLWED